MQRTQVIDGFLSSKSNLTLSLESNLELIGDDLIYTCYDH
jgi:hypothetical protein